MPCGWVSFTGNALIVPQIAFSPGPHAVGAAAAPLDKDKGLSAKTHPLQRVRAGKRLIKIRGSIGGRSFHESAILSSKDGILERHGSAGFIDMIQSGERRL